MRHPLPKVPLKGQYFYIVTPNPESPRRQYLHCVIAPKEKGGPPRIQLAPVRSMAKPFDNIELAKAFANFLNRLLHLDMDFCISMEKA